MRIVELMEARKSPNKGGFENQGGNYLLSKRVLNNIGHDKDSIKDHVKLAPVSTKVSGLVSDPSAKKGSHVGREWIARQKHFNATLDHLLSISKDGKLDDNSIYVLNDIIKGEKTKPRSSQETELANVHKGYVTRTQDTFSGKRGIPEPLVSHPKLDKAAHGRQSAFELKIVEKDGENVIYKTGVKDNNGNFAQLLGGLPMIVKNLKGSASNKPDEWWIGKRISASAVIIWPNEDLEEYGYIILGKSDYTEEAKDYIKSKKGASIPSGGTGAVLLCNEKGEPIKNGKETIAFPHNKVRVGSGQQKMGIYRDENNEAILLGLQLQIPSYRVP